jgi:RecA/RadA recombinase
MVGAMEAREHLSKERRSFLAFDPNGASRLVLLSVRRRAEWFVGELEKSLEEADHMKILRFTAENIKKLKVVSITPTGAVVEITGPNGSGKTSVLDAIYYALGGAKDIPTQPIRRGQTKAHVALDLGDITVIRKFSKDTGTSLVVEAKNGARYPTPQRMLDELLGKLTFDPLAFSRMEPKKQLEQIRSMVKLELDIDALDRENASDFEKRTDLNREIKSLAAQGFGFTFPEDTPDEEIDISKLAGELEEIANKNAAIVTEQARRTRVALEISDGVREAERIRIEKARLEREIDVLVARAADLEEKAKAIDNIADRERNALNSLPAIGESLDSSEIRTLMSQAQVINQAVAKKKQQSAIFAQAKTRRAKVEELTEAMAARTNAKQTAIAAAKMPIDGLSFGDGEVVYNDLPFSQASAAEQLRISVAVAMAANPKLRVLRIEDGSLLDTNSMKILASMAEAADYQVWIERVDTTGKVGIVMEDGHVKGAPEEKEKATA